MQPWNFVVIRSREVRQALWEAVDRERRAAGLHFQGEAAERYLRLKVEGIREAPVVICVTSDPSRGGPHVLGRNSDDATDLYSAACALQNIWLAARAEGVAVGWVTIFKKADVRAILGIPPHVNPIVLLCVGYTERFPERPLLEEEGWARRLDLRQLVFAERWGNPPPEGWWEEDAGSAGTAGAEVAGSAGTPGSRADERAAEVPILVSACLAGLPCRYDGGACPHPGVLALVRAGRALPVCPEQLGGLPTPRPPAEIQGGDGGDVLEGRARVVDQKGEDVTERFLRGAEAALALARAAGVREAILKARSPSCGAGAIRDGSFSGTLRAGDGVTAALLRRHGIEVATEDQTCSAGS